MMFEVDEDENSMFWRTNGLGYGKAKHDAYEQAPVVLLV
jgi:hypothetical protein